MTLYSKSTLAAAVLATMCFLSVPKAEAAFYHFDISTGVLTGASGNPFSLDLTLVSGGSFSNTVTISNFLFAGGSPTGSITTTNATGSFAGTVTLTSGSSPFSDLYQSFTNGTTRIQFDVNTTTVAGGTPDAFFVSILDSTATPINTTDTVNGSLAELEIHTNTLNDPIVVTTFQSAAPSPTGVTTGVVPEPASGVALIGGLGMLLGFRRRRA